MPNEQDEKSFAELLEESGVNVDAELRLGQRIRGRIISMEQETVYVDTGSKVDAVAEKQELLDENGQFPYQAGDEIELIVISRKQNEIRLGRAMGKEGGLQELNQAMHGKIPVSGKIKETCKGGVRVKIMEQTAFCPMSQLDIRAVQQPEALVGQELQFMVTRIEEKGRNIVVSRRELLEKAQAESFAAFASRYQPGDLLQGRITRIEPYGAFVQVEYGLEGLIHISELGWSKNKAAHAIVSPGELVWVKLLNMQDQGKGAIRLDFSVKQAQQDPWEEVGNLFKPGMLVNGTVTRTAPFGAFVEIDSGIEGLVHISEMSYLKRVHKPEDEVSVGDKVAVMIKDVDPASRRISLSMRDAEGDPWLGIEDRYPREQIFQGSIEKKEDFGLFIRLEPGVVGLLPNSKIEPAGDASLHRKKPGDTILVTIESIDQEKRRITLVPAESDHSGEWKTYAAEEMEFNTLEGKLKEAMRRKKS